MLIREFIIKESVDNVAVFYGGRFQPMHQGHFTLYKKLTGQFGAGNVFIATTFGQKQQAMHKAGNYSTDPFTFEEKQAIMGKMFGIPSNHVLNTLPYKPDVTLAGRQPDNTAIVLVFSAKDTGRLGASPNVLPYPDREEELLPASSGKVYYIEMPIEQGGMSATDFRNTMASNSSPDKKAQVFQQFFGKFNQEIFDFIEDRLTQ